MRRAPQAGQVAAHFKVKPLLPEEKREIVKEVVINDAKPNTRHYLTKRATQDEIQKRTHTVIVTKGRYYPPNTPQVDGERPLHLRIIPGGDAGQVWLRVFQCLGVALHCTALCHGTRWQLRHLLARS